MAKDKRNLPVPEGSSSLTRRDTSAVDFRPNGPTTREQELTAQQTRQDLLEQEAQKLKAVQATYQLGQLHHTVSQVHTAVANDIATRAEGDYTPQAKRHIEHFSEVQQHMAERHLAETLETGFSGINQVAGRSVTPPPEPPKKKRFWE